MSNDLAALLAGGPNADAAPRRCKYARLVAGLDPATAAALDDALRSPAWTDVQLARTIGQAGHGSISSSSLSYHRTATCACDPTTETSNA